MNLPSRQPQNRRIFQDARAAGRIAGPDPDCIRSLTLAAQDHLARGGTEDDPIRTAVTMTLAGLASGMASPSMASRPAKAATTPPGSPWNCAASWSGGWDSTTSTATTTAAW